MKSWSCMSSAYFLKRRQDTTLRRSRDWTSVDFDMGIARIWILASLPPSIAHFDRCLAAELYSKRPKAGSLLCNCRAKQLQVEKMLVPFERI